MTDYTPDDLNKILNILANVKCKDLLIKSFLNNDIYSSNDIFNIYEGTAITVNERLDYTINIYRQIMNEAIVRNKDLSGKDFSALIELRDKKISDININYLVKLYNELSTTEATNEEIAEKIISTF